VTTCKAVLSLAVLLVASVQLALAQGTYTQIDFPGAADTLGFGIDTVGDVVGDYVTTENEYGFALSDGVYTTIAYPGAADTYPSGINDVGQVVGYSYPSWDGFVYDLKTGTFDETFHDTRALETQAVCINNAGLIGGGLDFYAQGYGFELLGSTYKVLRPPMTNGGAVVGVTASGKFLINARNLSANLVSFLYGDGVYTQIPIPNQPNAAFEGVNPQGTVFVGDYSPSTNVVAGFVLQGKQFTPLQFPGSTQTYAYGINRSGVVVGWFYDSNTVAHGFTWTPPADAAKK
jgi:probable HAF family extracellular repeat protein